jgi:hypothetical protein
MFPPQMGAPSGAGPAMPGMPPIGGPPPGMGGAPMGGMGAPGQAQQSAPATLMSALLGPLAMMQEQEAQSLREQQALQIQNLVGALAMPNPAGQAAMTGPAPVGMGEDPALAEDPMAMGGGY